MNKKSMFERLRRKLSAIAGIALAGMIVTTVRPAYSQAGVGAAKAIDPEAIATWLKANAVPLKSVQAGAGLEDLRPLKKVFKDVKIVGLGEATHGTREFFQFKHRMTEFLVKEMGFTVFAIEASYPACLNINDYVVYGKGDREVALSSQGFWTWDTNEVLDLIDWMREYNKNLPEAKRIKFLGYDMQSYDHAYARVYPYLQRVDPEYLQKAGADFLPARVNPREFKGDEDKMKFRAKINEVIQYMVANKARLSKASSPREYAEALHCVRVMDQWADGAARLSTAQPNPQGGRDYYMAKNVEYIMNSEGPKTKIVSWAHNGHTSLDGYPNTWSLGRHLRKMYGNGYYALAFAFNQGGFQAMNMDQEDKENPGLNEFIVGPAPEYTIDWYLARPGIKNYVMDFRTTKKSPEATQWLATLMPMKRIGAAYNKKKPEDFLRPTVLKDNYDGIIFMEMTSRARPNPKWAKK